MSRFLRQSALTLVALGAMTAQAGIVNGQGNITGYYRVKNAQTGKYVQVTGPFTVAPDQSKGWAVTQAGTVMRLRAFADYGDAGRLRYKVGNLSSQGIEVFGAPRADYMQAVQEIAADISTNNFTDVAYSMQRHMREIGYISSGRAVIEALFQVVAARLDSEISGLSQEQKDALGYDASQESLEDFAKRFNAEVSDKIDLNAYMEPVAGAEDTYRVYFHWIDCKGVSDFYHATEQNTKSFNLGFECMRQYMNGKSGLASGEHIDAREAALFKSWGYDISRNYSAYLNDGVYDLSYELIFGDHELLYNWLKMYIIRFFDPEQAPDAEIMGINFKAFAEEMQRHEITRGFYKYMASMQENQRLYLTTGRWSDGTNEFSTVGTVSDGAERFGLLATEQADASGAASRWKFETVNAEGNYFTILPMAEKKLNAEDPDKFLLSALYTDFPMEAVHPDKIKFYGIGDSFKTKELEAQGGTTVTYLELGEPLSVVPRLTPVLVKFTGGAAADNAVRIPWQEQSGDYDPAVDGFSGIVIGGDDEVVDKQHAPSRADASNPVEAFHGVLLETPNSKEAFDKMWGIDLSSNVYALSTFNSNSGAKTPWFSTVGDTVPANHAFVVPDPTVANQAYNNMIAVTEPPVDLDLSGVTTGIDGVTAATMQPDVVYDLQGRPVANPVSGNIYILNGKKILVK